MSDRPRESDWKLYSSMIPELRERYLEEKNRKFASSLNEPGKTETERFWETLEAMDEEAGVLRACLDDHRRSEMINSMSLMFFHGMISVEDLEQFSSELRETVQSIQKIFYRYNQE